MATIAEFLASTDTNPTEGAPASSIADFLNAPTPMSEKEAKTEETKATAELLDEPVAKVKDWAKDATIDGQNVSQLQQQRIKGTVPGDPELTKFLNDPNTLKDPALIRKAEVLRDMAKRIELNQRVEKNLPETLKFAGFDTGIKLNKSVAAGLVGVGDMMQDSIHGIQQIIGVNEEKLAHDQAIVRDLYASTRYGGAAGTGAVVGAIAEPLGVVVPIGKTNVLWKTALASAAVTGAFGATGYVDKEAGQTRLGNAAMAAAAGLVFSPIVHGLNKAIDATSAAAFKKSSNQMLDTLDLQVKKFQKAGASPNLAWRAAKKKLGMTDETVAAATLSADRKIHIGSRSQAIKDINKIEQLENAVSVAPTTQLGKSIERLASPVSTRLQRLSPRVFHRLKAHDAKVQRRETELFHRVNPFLKGISKLDNDTQLLMKKSLLTGDFAEVNKLLHTTGNKNLIAEFGQVRKALGDVYKDLKQVGYKDLPEIVNYFPRIVKKGSVEEVSRLQQDQVSKALRVARSAKGMELTPLEVSRVMDKLIVRTGNRTFAHTSGSLKKRAKHRINDELLPHYEDPTAALHSYLRATVSDIERRKLFSDFGYKGKLSVTGGDLESSIGAVLHSERLRGLDKSGQNEIVDILRARFGPGENTSSRNIQIFKNLTYAVTLGNPLSAATQLGDVVFSAQKNGVLNTVISLFGNKLVKKDVLGLEDAMEDFTSTHVTKKILDWSLKWSGFKKIDALGKETLLNSSLRKFNQMSKTEKGQKAFIKEWGKYFEGDTLQLLDDVRNKKLTENVKLMLWHELSGVQPISLSEMPQKYLEHPDGRVLYMLRTFTIKQFDFMRREIFNLARKGKNLEAATAAAKFAGLFIIANASIDAFRDFMQGKEIDMEDHLVDNAWSLLGVNKFTVDSVTRQGPGRAAIDFLAPPLTVVDDAYRAIDDPKRLWNLLPPYGKMIHGWLESDRDNYYQSLDLGKFEPSEIKGFLDK